MTLSRLLTFILCPVIAIIILFVVCDVWQNKIYTSPTRSLASNGIFDDLSSFRVPAALFPPSALISLTDDNATFFVARPAAFGPLLPAKGLSGQLWAASGFGEHITGLDGKLDSNHGELGCSDIPGWDGFTSNTKKSRQRHDDLRRDDVDGLQNEVEYDAEDRQTSQISLSKSIENLSTDRLANLAPHADIQSLQESAEITGKIVLLSRGGCGFLEKVKWAQRRGSTAVIVGDNVPGRALITMFARGDTSNITIPALFTTHTTAQFLSSLIPYDGLPRSISGSDKIGKEILEESNCEQSQLAVVQRRDKVEGNSQSIHHIAKVSNALQQESYSSYSSESRSFLVTLNVIWKSIIQYLGAVPVQEVVNRPDSHPHRGDDFDLTEPDNYNQIENDMNAKDVKNLIVVSPKTDVIETDDFIIGVQDWRDPDIVKHDNKPTISTPDSDICESGNTHSDDQNMQSKGHDRTGHGGSAADPSGELNSAGMSRHSKADNHDTSFLTHDQGSQTGDIYHAGGLWVTITPAKMSSSPFFDTLLILVVSPLVTLMVVYALLLLRTRLYRRRWRAPKSLVERLPVRTYQTMTSDSSSQQSGLATALPVSPTTPLLTAVSSSVLNPTSTILEGSSQTQLYDDNRGMSSQYYSYSSGRYSERSGSIEKRISLDWKRCFGLRQRECVICLEDYVDGISQVMSLPCGHDFHAECITPWLTTRRRTCPICKDDVVRCLTHDVSWSSHHGTTCESPVVEDDYSRNARGLHGSIVGDRTGNNNINHFTSQTEMESEYGDFGGGDTVVTSLGERSVSTSRTTNSSERRGSFARFLRNTLLSLRTNFSR